MNPNVKSLVDRFPAAFDIEDNVPQAVAQPAFKIEDHIPFPPQKNLAARYPFAQLRVGQSFFVPGREKYSSVGGCVRNYRRKCPTIKLIYKKLAHGTRVWRQE